MAACVYGRKAIEIVNQSLPATESRIWEFLALGFEKSEIGETHVNCLV